MSFYKKGDTLVQAIEFTGTLENVGKLVEFCLPNDFSVSVITDSDGGTLYATITTYGGFHWVKRGNMVIKQKGMSVFHCKPDEFKRTYTKQDNEKV